MAKGPAYMALYPADYMAGTWHLTTEQHGAYLLLIMHYWQKGGVPKDDVSLASITRLPIKKWKTAKPIIAEFFGPDWRHERVEKELEKARKKSEQRSHFGSRGGSAKSLKDKGRGLAKASVLLQQKDDFATPFAIASSSYSSATHLSDASQLVRAPDPAPPAAASAAMTSLDEIENRCREAAGLERDPSPGLLVIGPIRDLIAAGWDLEAHILPPMRAAKASGKQGKSWAYYAKIITNGASAPPKAEAPPPAAASPQAKREAEWSNKLAYWRKSGGGWYDQWGSPPGSPSCVIPESFIASFQPPSTAAV